MTGRAAGYCAGYGTPGFAVAAPGRACGRGVFWGRGLASGRGLGRGAWFRPVAEYGRHVQIGARRPWGVWRMGREEELEYLKCQATALKEELNVIGGRIHEMESEAAAGEGEGK